MLLAQSTLQHFVSRQFNSWLRKSHSDDDIKSVREGVTNVFPSKSPQHTILPSHLVPDMTRRSGSEQGSNQQHNKVFNPCLTKAGMGY